MTFADVLFTRFRTATRKQDPIVLHASRDHRVRDVPRRGRGDHPGNELVRLARISPARSSARTRFQVRRSPIQIGLFDDEEFRRIQKRPRITETDAEAVIAAIPNAVAVSIQSGWPTPIADIQFGTKTLGDVAMFGVTAPYQVIQDYTFASGRPLTDLDVAQRRRVAVIGADVADKLFENVDPVGKDIRILGNHFTVVGVIAKKGRVLGQSFDGFVLAPPHHLRVDLRPTEDHDGVCEDGARRRRRRGNGARRGSDARGAPAASRRGKRLFRRDGGRSRRILEKPHTRFVLGHSRDRGHRHRRAPRAQPQRAVRLPPATRPARWAIGRLSTTT